MATTKDALKKIHAVHPHLVSAFSKTPGEHPPSPQPSKPGEPDWCKCGSCTQTPEEQICCGKTFSPCLLTTGAAQISTIVLDVNVLHAAVHVRNDLFALQDNIN